MYLDDLIAGAQKIQRLTQAHSRDSFVADEAAFDAVLFNLQVIGEAMKRLLEAGGWALVGGSPRGPGPVA